MSLLRWHKGSGRPRAKSSPYRLMQSRSGLTGTLGVNRRNDSLRRLQSSVARGGDDWRARIGDEHEELCAKPYRSWRGRGRSRACTPRLQFHSSTPAVSVPVQTVNPHDEAARLIKTLDLSGHQQDSVRDYVTAQISRGVAPKLAVER